MCDSCNGRDDTFDLKAGVSLADAWDHSRCRG
jgi:hypothetical protein